jgi:LemA protein
MKKDSLNILKNTKAKMKNNKGQLYGIFIVLGIIILIIFLGILWAIGTYNSLVKSDVNVENSWAKVQTAYERRIDLIPNLVETVKGAAGFEQVTQTQIASLRSGVTNAKSASQLTSAGSQADSLISNLIVSVEAYPQLKATENFKALQDELAGTENRIKWERDNFNDAVKDYKTKVRTFPSNILAGMYGFTLDKWEMFESTPGAENAPKVQFNYSNG